MCKPSVAPSQARGLKLERDARGGTRYTGRAFTGAWIETDYGRANSYGLRVAPSQARGLKPLAAIHPIILFMSRLHRRVD